MGGGVFLLMDASRVAPDVVWGALGPLDGPDLGPFPGRPDLSPERGSGLLYGLLCLLSFPLPLLLVEWSP